MNKYAIHCTEAQTRKALGLSVPIEVQEYISSTIPLPKDWFPICNHCFHIPSAEELIGYLEEKYSLHFLTGIDDEDKFFFNVYHAEGYIEVRGCNSRKEATLAAIDAALEYLTNKEK